MLTTKRNLQATKPIYGQLVIGPPGKEYTLKSFNFYKTYFPNFQEVAKQHTAKKLQNSTNNWIEM